MPTADELVNLALLAMLHDKTGLTGEIDYVGQGFMRDAGLRMRWSHLENCADAAVVGPIECEQDATDTGTGFEVLTAPIGCPHGEPVAAKTAGYGIGGLLGKMIELGERVRAGQEGGDDD